jgi:hypothetical protein
MAMIVATRKWEYWRDCVDSWQDTAHSRLNCVIVADKDVIPAYQRGYEQTTEQILGYVHDDLVIYEKGWDTRVLREFENPNVGVVGFTGALGHGTVDLYKNGYFLPNLARQIFMSNMRDAEKHGLRFAGECDVAICDGLGVFVRREILDRVNGWEAAKPYGYFLYAEWLCCETRRQGYRIRMVGVDCQHLGGKSSQYIANYPTYEDAHYYLWVQNRDVLPYRVPE